MSNIWRSCCVFWLLNVDAHLLLWSVDGSLHPAPTKESLSAGLFRKEFGLKYLKEVHHSCLKYCRFKKYQILQWGSGPGPNISKYLLWFILFLVHTRWMGVASVVC